MKSYEEKLPEKYREIYCIDAKDKKTSIIMTVGAFVLMLAVVLVFVPHFDLDRVDADKYPLQSLIMMLLMIANIILHELVHGAAYKIMTGRKLTFGLTATVAYCGVPDIYCYRKCALISLLAPFTVFNLIYIPLICAFWNNMNLYIITVILFGVHFSGCIGDLYVAWLLISRFTDERLLINDTGPKQSFYMPDEEQKKYKAIIFDLDGTLLDTLEDLADSVNSALREYGYSERSLEEVRSFVGNGVKVLVKLASGEEEGTEIFDSLCAFQRKYYTANCMNYTKPYEGIIQLLEELKQQGYITAIVSNKFDTAVKKLAEHYFPGLIDLAVGESETVRKKPCPDTLLAVLQHFNLNKDEAVYVGDSEVDIETSHNAEMDCIAVSYGFRDRDQLETEIIADSVSELKEILLKK